MEAVFKKANLLTLKNELQRERHFQAELCFKKPYLSIPLTFSPTHTHTYTFTHATLFSLKDTNLNFYIQNQFKFLKVDTEHQKQAQNLNLPKSWVPYVSG